MKRISFPRILPAKLPAAKTRFIIIALLLGAWVCSVEAFAQTPTNNADGTVTVTYNYSTGTNAQTYTFTVPAGVTSLKVEGWGGGGAGGGRTNAGGAGGGAGGNYVVNNTYSASSNQQFTVGVGATQTGNTTNNGAANKGNPSWFGSLGSTATTASFIADGGNGGAANSGTAGTAANGTSTGGTITQGVAGTNAGANNGGAGGRGGNTIAPAGNGGASQTANADGNDGSAPGGGGGGAYRTGGNRNGGDGAAGQVKITYFSLSVTAPSQACTSNGAVFTVSSSSLQDGTYTVTYKVTGTSNSIGSATASATLASGTGTFTTSSLSTAESDVLTITAIAGGTVNQTGLTVSTSFTVSNCRAWYSYQTGWFGDATSWTLDPSGTTYLNGLGLTPGTNDDITILNGKTINYYKDATHSINNLTLNSATIQSGAILDMSTTTGHSLGIVTGTGTLRIKGAATIPFPGGTYTDFVASGGGTVEYYDVSGTLPTTQIIYNNLTFTNSTASAIIFTEASNLTVNGTFTVGGGTGSGTTTWRINDNSTINRSITLNGDLNVLSNGVIAVFGGTAGTPHAITMYGNITNSGVVRFFDTSLFTDAAYNTATVLRAALNGKAANVTFNGTTDQTVTCNNSTYFYRFIVDKGTTQTPMVTVNSTNANYFRLYGSANLSAGGGVATIILNNALAIANGTLHLTGAISIPSLIENNNNTGDTYDFYGIPNTAGLWLDGSAVSVTVTQNLAGNNEDQRLIVNGLLKVSNGTFTGGYSKGLGTTAGGTVIVEGGTVNAWQYRVVAGVGTVTVSSAITYTQSGGKVYLGTTGYNNGTETLPTITGVTGGAFDQYARFSLADATSVFNMSGGDLHIGPPTAYNIAASNAGGLDIQGSYTVTGGTVHMYIPNGAHTATGSTPSGNGTNAKHFSIYSTAPLYNVNIYRLGTTGTVGTTACVATLMSSLTILNNLTLMGTNNPALYCDGYADNNSTTSPGTAAPTNNNLTVGGNFVIQSGATFVPSSGTGVLTFNGSAAQSWTNSGTISTIIPAVVVNKTGTLTVTNSLGQNITGLTLTNGTFADNGNTLTVTGTLTNNATHTSTGTGSITYSGTNTIGGNNGTFGNLFITTAGTSTVNVSGNQTVTGTLRLVNNTSLSIGDNALIVQGGIYDAATGTTAGFSTTKRIVTAGLFNAGGLTRYGSARDVSTGDLLFPLGTGTLYTPNTINVVATTHGTITVRPVSSEHPDVTAPVQSVQYYWRITSSGYAGITAVTHKSYTFSTATKNGTTTQYRPARFDPGNFTWATCNTTFNATGTTIPDFNVNTGSGNWTGTGITTVDKLDGEYTCGYTTAFGTMVAYYSKGSGAWNAASGVWTDNSDHATGGIAGPPCSYCPVVIGKSDGSFNHKIDIDAIGRGCGRLELHTNTVLDCGAFTGISLGTNTSGKGTLRVGSGTFPSGDFINFIGAGGVSDGGTVEWYGAAKTIPTTATGLTGSMPTTGSGTPALGGMTAGTYQNIAATTNGSGTGALFTVVITNATTIGSITVSQAGTGYVSTNTLTFSGSSFGGTGSRTVTLASDDIITINLTSYYNLVINPNSGATITLPATNLTVYNNWLQGSSPFGTYSGTVTNNGARTLAVTGNMTVSSGTFSLTNSGNTTITVGGDVSNSGTFSTASGTHTLTVTGGVVNNSTMNFNNTGTVALTFSGNNTVTFGGSGTPTTTLYTVTVNKGTSQGLTVIFNTPGTINTTPAANGWLKLQNGTFDFANTGTVNTTLSNNSSYTIPSTAKLKVSGTNVTVNTTSADATGNDLFLNGALEVTAGTVNVGSTTGTTNDVDIEYASAGTPAINVSGGSLWVRSSIRRSTSVATGALAYNQTGGIVTVGGIASDNTRGVFEIDANTGSSFTMNGGGTLTVQRQTSGNGYADVYINPSTSTVDATSTINVGLTGTVQNNFRVNIVPSVGNFTVQGSVANIVNLYHDLVLMGNLTINTPASLLTTAVNPNANVTIGGDFLCTGTASYNTSGSNTTTFKGTDINSGNNTAGLTANTDFYNVVVDKSSGTLLVSGTAPTASKAINNLDIESGTLEVSTLTGGSLKVNRNISIKGSATGAQDIEVYSTSGISNTITSSSSGVFTNLTLGGTVANTTVNVSGNLTINGTLNLLNTANGAANRYLNIASSRLTFGSAAPSPSTAGNTAFIRTNGVASDLGVVKTWASAGTFVYAVGTSTNYTPVSYSLGTGTGTLTIVPINSAHATAITSGTTDQYLNYYWTVTRSSSLAATPSGSFTFKCPSSLLSGSTGTLVPGYLDPNALASSGGWVTNVAGSTAGIASGTLTLLFPNTPTSDFPSISPYYYDYSAGTTITLPAQIKGVYSKTGSGKPPVSTGGGNWTTASNWTYLSDGDLANSGAGDFVANASYSYPHGLPVTIKSGTQINMDVDGLIAYKTTIEGPTGVLYNASTAGHSLGAIGGTGTFRTATGTFPAGTYDAFVAATGGTIEYAGAAGTTPPYSITMNSLTTYNNLVISNTTINNAIGASASTVTMSGSNITVNGTLTISASGLGSPNVLDDSQPSSHGNISIAKDFSNAGTFLEGTSNVSVTGNLTNTGTYNGGSGTVNLSGNFSNGGTFTAGTGTVAFNGTAPQTITGATTFNNLTINNTSATLPQITLSGSDEVVSSTLTMTKGNIFLNGKTLTIGTSTALPGALSHLQASTNGWMYGGNLKRYFSTSTFTAGTTAGTGFFPMGTATDFRPFFIGVTTALTAGGSFTLSNSSATNTIALATPITDTGGNPSTTIFLQHQGYWSVSTPDIAGGTYDIIAGGTGFGTINSYSDVTLCKTSGTVGQWVLPNSISLSDPRMERTGLSLLDITTNGGGNQFFVGSTNAINSPLPIELLSFTGEAKKYGVDLQWQTASEMNNDFFTVLRSAAGANFESIGTVNGNGTTNSSHSYSLIDYKPLLGKNYYQLKQTDFDGHITTSETIVVDVLSLDPLVSIYPNPLSQNQMLNVVINGLATNSPTEIQIVNVQGTTVNGATLNTDSDGSLSTSIALTGLSSGLYILKVQNVHYKFVIE